MIFIKIFIFFCILTIISILSKRKDIITKTNIPPAIEPPQDIPKKYYCVSWNLTTGEVIEHETE